MTDVRGNANPVEGAAVHDDAVAENPILLGGEARTTTPTAVADGDAVRLQADDRIRHWDSTGEGFLPDGSQIPEPEMHNIAKSFWGDPGDN